MLEFDLWRILDILFKKIEVGEKLNIIFRNLSCRNSVDSVAEILSEILRVFTQYQKFWYRNT